MEKTVFTFWEPKESIPAYIKLCMQTWKKFLPDYKIIILDYSNLFEYIDKNCYDKILFKKFNLAKQADAIRCAVLKQHGGIWLDSDSIITSDKFKELMEINSDFVLIQQHISFIKAVKNSQILNLWENEIKERIKIFKNFKLFYKFFDKPAYKNLKNWDYLGNGIINKYLSIANEKHFHSINKSEIKAFPECNYYSPQSDTDVIEAYRNFWFNNDFTSYLEEGNLGTLICLHNSWTPQDYKKYTEAEVLEKNCTLSKLLRNLC